MFEAQLRSTTPNLQFRPFCHPVQFETSELRVSDMSLGWNSDWFTGERMIRALQVKFDLARLADLPNERAELK
jgi:hypothetical protein